MTKSLIRFGIVVAILSQFGCATTGRDWERAQLSNTLSAYEDFLAKHPESTFTSEARRRIDEFNNWAEAQHVNTTAGYDAFLAKYPHSTFAAEARTRSDQLSWAEAQRVNTTAGYAEFLAKHSETTFAAEARRRILVSIKRIKLLVNTGFLIQEDRSCGRGAAKLRDGTCLQLVKPADRTSEVEHWLRDVLGTALGNRGYTVVEGQGEGFDGELVGLFSESMVGLYGVGAGTSSSPRDYSWCSHSSCP